MKNELLRRDDHDASGQTHNAVRSVYRVIAQHQREERWDVQKPMAFLQHWAKVFNQEFKLEIPKLVLCLDRLPLNRYGHFREGHNGFGLEGEIAINSRYLTGERATWEILGTLLHEMLHAWQATHGTPSQNSHHNAEFRRKAAEFGLLIDENGITSFEAEGRFKDLIRKFGIDVPSGEVRATKAKKRGTSKLRKYTCGCTNLRVAKKEFRALCLLCNREFLPDPTTGRPRDTSSTSLVPE